MTISCPWWPNLTRWIVSWSDAVDRKSLDVFKNSSGVWIIPVFLLLVEHFFLKKWCESIYDRLDLSMSVLFCRSEMSLKKLNFGYISPKFPRPLQLLTSKSVYSRTTSKLLLLLTFHTWRTFLFISGKYFYFTFTIKIYLFLHFHYRFFYFLVWGSLVPLTIYFYSTCSFLE